jgi:DNA-binding SARP family transcriptional activator
MARWWVRSSLQVVHVILRIGVIIRSGDPVSGFRPKPSALFLERPRLLRLLPEEAGYVVWLEAPYGYGKSVLTAQWATKLEVDGWRVIWLALLDGDPRLALAASLGLPEISSWVSLLTALASTKTVLIFEDLEHQPDVLDSLGPLFKHSSGLVLLASRRRLSSPELLRARSEGRLVHLTAQHLAFTPFEAKALFGDQSSLAAWDRTRGWPLPLHMAALTGEVPEEKALWEGVREGLEPEEWLEVLFMAALPYLPSASADDRASRLAMLGFVQALENGFRLHPLAAETISKAHRDAIKQVVQNQFKRLPLTLQAEACARVGLIDELEVLFEDVDLAAFDSRGVLRWDALCQAQHPTAPSPGRLLTLGWAYSVTGQRDQAMQCYLLAARHPQAAARQRIQGLGWALFDMPADQVEQAEALFAEAQPWLTQVEPSQRGTFLANSSGFVLTGQRWEQAEALLEEALLYLLLEHQMPCRINLGLVRWERRGELMGYVPLIESSLQWADNSLFNQCAALEALGRIHALLGEANRALGYFDRAAEMGEHNPQFGWMARVQATSLRGQVDGFLALQREAEAFGDITQAEELPLDFVQSVWAQYLREHGRSEQAHTMLEEALTRSDSQCIRVEFSLTRHALGLEVALEVLEPAIHSAQRWNRMLALAARYRIAHDLADLDQLLTLTDVGAYVLPTLVPLTELPKERPELSEPYPLAAVLRSNWKSAIQHRHAEIPALEVRVLGGFEVRLHGQIVNLTARPRDILLLLTLRLNRDRIAETLWPEADTDKSRNNLHVNLNALRKVVEPWGVPTYILESGLTRASVDLWDLDRALAVNDMTSVQRLYADLAPGFDLEVVEDTRINLRERTLEAVLEHATKLIDSDPASAETALEWLLDHEPSHEMAFGKLLELLVRSGRRFSAERRYRQFTEHLRNDVGLEPSPEIKRILAV